MPLKPVTLLLLLLCIFLHSLPAKAQEPYFRHITQKEGIISEHILSAVEDSLGFIWFSTQKGVTRFDGTSFKSFRPGEGLTEFFVFHASKKPNTNTLYFISRNFRVFCRTATGFKHIRSKELIAWNTFDEKGEPVFIGRLGHLFRIQGDSLVRIYNNPDSTSIHYHIRSLGKDRFIATSHAGAFTLINGKRYNLPMPKFSFRSLVAFRVFVTHSRRIFLTNCNGIYELDADLKTVHLRFPFSPANELYDLFEDPATGTVWGGTLHGLFRFDKGIIDNKHLRVFLKNSTVCNLTPTSDGLILCSTGGDGCFISSLKAMEIDLGSKGKNEVINHIKKDDDDLYYFTSDGNIGLVYKEQVVPFKPHFGGALEKIQVVYKLKEGGLLLPTDKMHYIRKRKMFTSEWVDDRFVFATYINDEYQPFISTKGAFRYMDGRVLIDGHKTDSLLEKHDPSNASGFFDLLLISMPRRMAYYPFNDGYMTFDFLTPKPVVNKYSLGSRVSCMAQLNDSTIIAGTHDKGVFIIIHNKVAYQINENNGLLSGHCYKIYLDKPYAWITTFGGVSRILLQGKYNKVTTFSPNDVLSPGEVNDIEIVNDKMYVATGGGLCAFDKNLKFPATKLKVIIEELSINSRDTTIATFYELPYNQNNISLAYTSPSIRTADKILFQHVVIKDNDTISKSYTSNSQLSLTALSPGEYKLSLLAKNIDGIWGAPTMVTFNIASPYWKSWWFILLTCMGAAALVMYIVLNRINVIRQQSSFKKQLVESELKALRLHMNPHFVFNSLTSLQSYILTNNNDMASSYITKFSRLLRLVMFYSQKGNIVLSEEVSLLTRYIELESVRFENQFLFSITVDEHIRQDDIIIPSLVIQPFVENAIKYGLSGRNNGMLKVNFQEGKNMIVCNVEDNGAGRAAVMAQQERSGREYNPTGIKYTNDRLMLLFTDKSIQPVTITDLYDENGQACGTRVELKIPIL